GEPLRGARRPARSGARPVRPCARERSRGTDAGAAGAGRPGFTRAGRNGRGRAGARRRQREFTGIPLLTLIRFLRRWGGRIGPNALPRVVEFSTWHLVDRRFVSLFLLRIDRRLRLFRAQLKNGGNR